MQERRFAGGKRHSRRMNSRRPLRSGFELLEVRHLLAANVLINEIHYDPDIKTEAVSFVELYNAGDQTADLAGWQLADAIVYAIPNGTTLAPQAYLVISEDPTATQTKFGVTSLGPFQGNLNNDGETAMLRDASGVTRDEVDYQLGFPWPTVGDAPGYSIELIHPSLENDLGGSWRSGGPTPAAINSVWANQAPPQVRQVNHSPKVPQRLDDVTITVKVTDPDGVASVSLQYQLVNPGAYIRITDPAYQTLWTTVAMRDDGTGGDEQSDDSIYTAVMAGVFQSDRRLVRYRIQTTDDLGDSIMVPYADDPQPNFAYFVDDGNAPWSGADRPGVTPVNVYSDDVMSSLATYHLLSRNEDVLESQYEYIDYLSAEASEYKWSATLVYDGVVYDHIRYRNRGWWSAYEWGKNKWKFDFNRGHYFQARDNWGNKYTTKWDKMNFSAGVLPVDFNPHRGEHGMFEALTYKLFDLMDVPAPNTHWVQFRVVDGISELNPANQYDGDFWGMYLVIEQPDGRFLDEHGLPDGNLHKMNGQWLSANNQGPTQETVSEGIAPGSALDNFIDTYQTSPSQSWWETNANLDAYYSYRAVVDAIHHYDIPDLFNSIYYHNPETNKWWMLPWDVDLTWDGNIYANDTEEFHQVIDRFSKHRVNFQSRARELQDLLFNADQGWQLIDDYAAVIADPNSSLTMADADRARWDWDPRMNTTDASVYTAGLPTTPADRRGSYYNNPTGDFSNMVQYMKNFMATGWGASNLTGVASDSLIPHTPSINYVGQAGFPANGLTFESSAFSDPQGSHTFGAIEWRLGEVTDPNAPAYDPNAEPSYEITAVWESGELTTFNSQITIPSQHVEPGHAYRGRVRMRDADRWSHWSDPIEFIAQVGPPADVFDALRITEINYNPSDPTSTELTAIPGLANDDFEFIEVENVDTSSSINLANVTLTGGVNVSFPDIDLGPGERAVIVEDTGAFQARYSAMATVLGQWSGGLSSSGEELVLTDAGGNTILDFSYDDNDPWPQRADGSGATLELIDSVNTPADQYGDYLRWRGSTELNGTPGSAGVGPLGVVINEVWSRTDSGSGELDAIELFNTTSDTVNLDGWYLSDSDAQFLKYAIPGTTMLGPGEYLVFDEGNFNPTPENPGPDDFALDGIHGDDVWLVNPNGAGGVLYFADDVHFGSAATGESFGRSPNAAGRLAPLPVVTLGAHNGAPRVGPLFISEVQYNPGPPSSVALSNDPTITSGDLQFIELHNPTGNPVDLTNWTLRGRPDFDFAPGTTLPIGGTLVVTSFDPDDLGMANRVLAFRAHYQIDASVELVGGFSDLLGAEADRIQLQRPGQPPVEEPTFVPRYVEDEVVYGDQIPWPAAADGTGNSLRRLAGFSYGNLAVSWMAGSADPGSAASTLLVPLPGDGNLDGFVDSADFGIWGSHRFTVGTVLTSGDYNGDGVTDIRDFNVWNSNKFTGTPLVANVSEGDQSRTPRAALGLLPNELATLAVDAVYSLPATDVKSLRYMVELPSQSEASNTASDSLPALATINRFYRLYSEFGRAAIHRRHDLFSSPPEAPEEMFPEGMFPEGTAFLVDYTFSVAYSP